MKKSSRTTSAQMRVKIAKDVLSRLTAGKLHPDYGAWVKVDGFDIGQLIEDEELGGRDISRCIRKVVKGADSCTTCALGAIFMSAVHKGGVPARMRLSGLGDGSGPRSSIEEQIFTRLLGSPLTAHFTRPMLRNIENCFEGGCGVHSDLEDGDRNLVAELYADTFCGARERMRAIMNNIIRNDGNFKPEQDINPDQLAEARDNIADLA